MEIPFTVIIAVVVTVIVLLLIIGLAHFARETGKSALEYLWNIPKFIEDLLRGKTGP